MKNAADGTAIKAPAGQRARFSIEAVSGGAVTPVYGSFSAVDADENGKVAFTGLADGVYKIKEISAPAGFISSARAEFQVTIKGGKVVYFHGTDLYGLAKDSGNADLSGNEFTDYSVINVRNVTELPKTGAAGIALFTALGLLLAGAAGTVYLKSRSTKRALRA